MPTLYDPEEKGWDTKRTRLLVAMSTFRDRLYEQSRKKSVKKCSFFLVNLKLEITRKSEKLDFQFEICSISNRHFVFAFFAFFDFFSLFLRSKFGFCF